MHTHTHTHTHTYTRAHTHRRTHKSLRHTNKMQYPPTSVGYPSIATSYNPPSPPPPPESANPRVNESASEAAEPKNQNVPQSLATCDPLALPLVQVEPKRCWVWHCGCTSCKGMQRVEGRGTSSSRTVPPFQQVDNTFQGPRSVTVRTQHVVHFTNTKGANETKRNGQMEHTKNKRNLLLDVTM